MNYDLFDYIGTGNGMETVGDRMRQQAREEKMFVYVRWTLITSILSLVATIILGVLNIMTSALMR